MRSQALDAARCYRSMSDACRTPLSRALHDPHICQVSVAIRRMDARVPCNTFRDATCPPIYGAWMAAVRHRHIISAMRAVWVCSAARRDEVRFHRGTIQCTVFRKRARYKKHTICDVCGCLFVVAPYCLVSLSHACAATTEDTSAKSVCNTGAHARLSHLAILYSSAELPVPST